MSNDKCINPYLHGMDLHGSVYTWISDHGVSGKIFVPCSVLQHMPWQILSTSFHVFSNLRELIWLSLAVQKELIMVLAFLHFPRKNPQPPEHLTSGIQPVFLQLLRAPAPQLGVFCTSAEQSRAGLHRSCQGVDGCGEGSPCWGHGHGIQQGRAGRAGREMLPAGPKEPCCSQGARPGLAAGLESSV